MNVGNIPPSILVSLKNQSIGWTECLGELCDNSFDQRASRIKIEFGPGKQLTVEDDGNGCDNIERMFTIGQHYKTASTALGRYGVGLKEAACWLWGETRLVTTHKGVTRKARIDWAALSKQLDWNVPDPTSQETGDKSGTLLVFRGVEKKFPDYAELQSKLGWTFAPALWAGNQIVLKSSRKNPITCRAWNIPDIEDIVQDRFEINGKRVHLKAGIVKIGVPNHRNGFSISHKHRMIQNSSFGSRGLSTSRICGIVELDRAWELSKNKTGIVDADNDALEFAIYERCKDILEKASSQAELIHNRELEMQVSESLQHLLTTKKKAKRDKGDSTGTVEPKQTERKHRRARKKQAGDTFLDRCKVGSVRMEWKHFDNGHVGSVDMFGNVIYLNEGHERLAYHRDNKNMDALVDTCLMLLSFEATKEEQIRRMPLFAKEHDGFIDLFSDVLHAQQETACQASAK